jgi:formate C-acetyltransferase
MNDREDRTYEINTRAFIVDHYTPYDGDASFLQGPTERTLHLWDKLKDLLTVERQRGGMYDIDEKTISTITSHKNGYHRPELEQIVGLQTDEPLKRAIMPFGGIRLVHTELRSVRQNPGEDIDKISPTEKTQQDGVFDVYPDEMKKVPPQRIITGLPDAYGRGRIIGDYRRVPHYGVQFLIEQKKRAKEPLTFDAMTEAVIQGVRNSVEPNPLPRRAQGNGPILRL